MEKLYKYNHNIIEFVFQCFEPIGSILNIVVHYYDFRRLQYHLCCFHFQDTKFEFSKIGTVLKGNQGEL